MTNNHFVLNTKLILVLSLAVSILFMFIPQEAKAASDKECAIWLCLPTGFGSGCGDAHKAFKKRLKKGKSPLPNWNSCSEGNDPEPFVFRTTYYTVMNNGKRVTESSGRNCPDDGYIRTDYLHGGRVKAICTVMEKYVTTMNDDGSQFIHDEERWGRPLEETKGDFKPSRY